MPKPRRNLQATADETTNPPPTLPPAHAVARVVRGEGKNLYTVALPSADPTTTINKPTTDDDEAPTAALSQRLLVELPARFRSAIWIRNGGYVLVDRAAFAGRENRLGGEIVNVVRDERRWRKMAYWPKEFAPKTVYDAHSDEDDDESEEESNAGMMPPSDDDDDSDEVDDEEEKMEVKKK